jgi:hypothetical protein
MVGLVALVLIGSPTGAARRKPVFKSGFFIAESGTAQVWLNNPTNGNMRVDVNGFDYAGTSFFPSTDHLVPPRGVNTIGPLPCPASDPTPCLIYLEITSTSTSLIPSVTYNPDGVDSSGTIAPNDFRR